MVDNTYTDDVQESTFDGLLKNAIESDTPTEHTVPLNHECVFVNGAHFEDPLKKASVKVTVLEHYPLDEIAPIEKWFIELDCDGEITSKEVSTGEEAVFEFERIDPVVEEGIDPIILEGAGLFSLSIVGYGEEHKNTWLKIKVS
jgi:hypothetical protein|tara:strand:+ start:15876 stop:16307 length:432 start_codon:yes stop_codon:yes gene_type:complete